MRVKAAILVQRGGPPAEKQENACLERCSAAPYEVAAIVRSGDPMSAVTMVRNGAISVIVTGYDSRVAQRIAAEIEGRGQVEIIHPVLRVIEPPRRKANTVGDLIRRWWRGGKSVKEIAALVGEDTADVRAILRRYGENPAGSR